MAIVPRYEKLTQLLRDKLTAGEFRVGDRFFSQNELMKKFELSFATVTRALNELEREGLLVREQGRGTFVRSLSTTSGSQPKADHLRAAVFIPWDPENPVHINFQRLYKGLETSRPPDCHLKMIPYSVDPSDLDAFLFSREKMDGVIFVYPNNQHMDFIKKLSLSLPVAVVGRPVAGPNVSSVYCDNTLAAEEAVNYLISMGHVSIGMIGGDLKMTDSPERFEGYQRALKAGGIAFDERRVINTHPAELNGYSAALDLFERTKNAPISAIFAAGDLIAMGVLKAAQTVGRSVPEELSVVGFDDVPTAPNLQPPLTTIHVPMEELASRAMEMLMELTAGGRGGMETLPARLIKRESVSAVVVGVGQ